MLVQIWCLTHPLHPEVYRSMACNRKRHTGARLVWMRARPRAHIKHHASIERADGSIKVDADNGSVFLSMLGAIRDCINREFSVVSSVFTVSGNTGQCSSRFRLNGGVA